MIITPCYYYYTKIYCSRHMTEELKKPQIKYESKLDLGFGKKPLRVYVLEDGRSMINADDINEFFGVNSFEELVNLLPEPQRTKFLKENAK